MTAFLLALTLLYSPAERPLQSGTVVWKHYEPQDVGYQLFACYVDDGEWSEQLLHKVPEWLMPHPAMRYIPVVVFPSV